MRTKRRLLYLPDEEATLLGDLTDSPRPRPSRLSRLAIFSSDDEKKAASVDDGTETPGAEVVDRALLVSYNSFALADGSGNFRRPMTAGEAMALYRSLRKCCRFLRTFLQEKSMSETSTDSLSTSTSEPSESSDSESESEPRQRWHGRRPKQAETLMTNGENYAGMTVAELRELLRTRNLPISGPKALLVSRLQGNDEGASKMEEDGQSTLMVSERGNNESSDANSFFSIESEVAKSSQNVWSAIVNMGSRLFRKSTGSLPEENKNLYRKRQRIE
ncbi:hypothetical protein TcYC6_0080790 [Trypanosoma cruzi]|uniref:SAP domain-containing protein n=2 Tax=Trypanosoma cruzi TaxID=5693 RepID=Q4CRA6_TRYCC|nr:hypothetical protein, conserved [Trypanosoma cruzi]EAN82810.1 hypothetical protein, conserved [Trypanosoma cruzi]KAF5223029.1 hypothetical protein ECC02_003856 [Trypanosoma cruzi]KAF8297468.1 hypothetical protein TcYC6_0080790 [Trypanosoma cruzi]RNC60227.1 hypothetical protein TcCL_ESM02014 [Trypanosoma cruzi]|eukprot:XP_804661.1 hypothetical protein [Trypanosoma cruzi strain CL Brener]